MSTHSPSFINLLSLDGFALVRKDKERGTWTKQLSRKEFTDHCLVHKGAPQKTKQDNIFEFYAANTTESILEGFFAKGIILVEGPTESLAVPEYLKAVQFDCAEKGIAVIPVGGKGNLARFWRLFSAYELPVYVIFDNDSDDDKKGNKRNELLATLGATDAKSILDEQGLRIESSFSVFGNDFETTLRNIFSSENYEDIEKEARDFIGIDPDNKNDCKPLVARFVAEKLSVKVDYMSDGWCDIDRMKLAIQALMRC